MNLGSIFGFDTRGCKEVEIIGAFYTGNNLEVIMTKNFFRVGDVVKLKGHSLRMTVMSLPPEVNVEKYISCAWFAGAQLERAVFDQLTLEMIPEDEL